MIFYKKAWCQKSTVPKIYKLPPALSLKEVEALTEPTEVLLQRSCRQKGVFKSTYSQILFQLPRLFVHTPWSVVLSFGSLFARKYMKDITLKGKALLEPAQQVLSNLHN